MDERISISLAVLFAVLPGTMACAHILHPAHVDPGFHVEVATARVSEQNRVDRDTVTDAQLALGYGKRYNDDTALGLQLVVPLIYDDEGPLAGMLGSVLDIYIQGLGDPVDLGVGVVLGMTPQLYGELGHRVEGDGYSYSFNMGTRVGLHTEISPFVIIDFVVQNGVRVGLFSEYTYYVEDMDTCYEGCSDYDYLESRLALGAFVGFRL